MAKKYAYPQKTGELPAFDPPEQLGLGDPNKKVDDSLPVSLKAVAVLEKQMMFYYEQSEELIAHIIGGLKEEGTSATLLAEMYKEFSLADKKARECAALLAPYQTPKLQTIEKNVTEKRYVVRLPVPAKNTEEWLKTVNPAPTIEGTSKEVKQ